MKNIILPTDFSDNSWNAIFTVLKMYHEVPCHFYILHAYEPNAMNMLGKKGQHRLGVIYDSLSAYSNQELNKILAYLKENHHNTNHTFEIVSKSDNLVNAVKEMLSEKDIDLLCMGTQGATGAKQVFMGSNTVKVLKKVGNCPILVVPNDYNFQTLKSLVFSTDFSKKYEKHQLSLLKELANLWKSVIQVVHISLEISLNDQQKTNQELLKERFKDLEATFNTIDFEADVAHSLEKFIAETKVDLVTLVRYQHTFWEKILGEPVVKNMTFHTQVPLLILPE